MTEALSWAATVRLVHERVQYCCEYCFTSQWVTGQAMHVDHIVPGAGDHPDNLALSCATCNLAKGDATEVLDSETEEKVPLFNPRTQVWSEHFTWIDSGCRIQGLTVVGRVTVERFGMNLKRLVVARSVWVLAGVHPPDISED